MGKYIDNEVFVWTGAVHQCFECRYWNKGQEKCREYGFGKDRIREKFQVEYYQENNCSAWRPGD